MLSSTKNDGKLVGVCQISGMKLVRGKYEFGRKVLQQGKFKGEGEIADTDNFFY